MNALHRRWLLAGLLVITVCVGCAPQQPYVPPTIARIPTDTPTYTPSITFTPSATFTRTPTPTITFTPSLTFTSTVTPPPTYTPSVTRTPSNTATLTFTPSPTFTATFTHTPSPTFTASNTFTPTVLPTILNFASSALSIPSGGQAVLTWQAEADLVTLELITPSGTIVSSDKVDAIGTRLVQAVPSLGSTLIYRLTAKRGKNAATRQLTITVQCANPWFFSPAPADCPSGAATQTGIRYQSLERGLAFYVPSTFNVYLLAYANSRVNAYLNEYTGQALTNFPPPAPNLKMPLGEIGFVWQTKPWSDGTKLDVALGWGTSDPLTYNSVAQVGNPTSDLYLRGPDGSIYKLALAGTGTWLIVPGAK